MPVGIAFFVTGPAAPSWELWAEAATSGIGAAVRSRRIRLADV